MYPTYIQCDRRNGPRRKSICAPSHKTHVCMRVEDFREKIQSRDPSKTRAKEERERRRGREGEKSTRLPRAWPWLGIASLSPGRDAAIAMQICTRARVCAYIYIPPSFWISCVRASENGISLRAPLIIISPRFLFCSFTRASKQAKLHDKGEKIDLAQAASCTRFSFDMREH